MDGVLIDSEPLWRVAEKASFQKVGISLTDDDCKLTMGYRTNEVVEYWWQKSPWEGLSATEVEEDIIANVSQLIMDHGEPLPGVDHSLSLIKKQGLKTGIASSSPLRLINAVLEKFQIGDRFDVIHSAEFEQKGKPDPAVFISTAEKLAILPEKCLVIEDSIHGLQAAKKAGMQVMVIPAEEDQELPEFSIADLKLQSLLYLNKEHLIFTL